MKRYRVLLNGTNFLLAVNGVAQRHGFYTTRWVEAADPDAAELAAVDVLRSEGDLRSRVLNHEDDWPSLYVEEIEEVEQLEPAAGFSFYLEEDETA